MKYLYHIVSLILLIFSLSAQAFTYENGGTVYYCYTISSNSVQVDILSSSTNNITVPQNAIEYIYDNRGRLIETKTYYIEKVVDCSISDLSVISMPYVRSIGFYAFSHCSALQSVSMPNVRSIGSFAFIDCSSLQSVSMPNVQSIDSHAFGHCSSLQSVSLPNVQSIDNGAFSDCSTLQSVSMPNVQSIGFGAFMGCSALQSVSMPNVRSIEDYAFTGCSALQSVSMPNVQSIDNGAFQGCSALQSVLMPNVRSIEPEAFSGCSTLQSVSMPNVQSIEKHAFSRCSALQSVSMPNVRSIEEDAFSSCSALQSVSMPNVQSIEKYAFSNCFSLQLIYINNPEPPEIYYDVFSYKAYENAKLIVPKAVEEAYRTTYPWSLFFIAEELKATGYTDYHAFHTPHGSNVSGFTADGKTQLLIYSEDLTTGNHSSSYNITASINGENSYDENLTGRIGNFELQDNGKYGFILTAPDGYFGDDNTHSYTIEFEITPVDEGQPMYAHIEVWRPGLLLIHGLNASSECWSEAYNYLSGTGAYTSSQIINVSYKNSNKVSFDDNTHRYAVVKHNMDNLFTQLYSQGIMSSRYDLVGHSMGGILSRKYAQEINAQHVNRIITFDTPHSGSQLALLPDKLNVSGLNTILNKISSGINTMLDGWMAYHDLNPNSEAISKLNNSELMSNANGIPVHAACTAFDGADENIDFLPSSVDNFISAFTLGRISLLWFARLAYKATEGISNLSNRQGLDMINNLLHDTQHDGVVSLASQTGGLSVRFTASLLTAKYEGIAGFGSKAHHCNMTNWDQNHQRLLSLLTATKVDARFARSFSPVNLSGQQIPQRSLAKTTATDSVKLHIDANLKDEVSRIVNISVTASPEVKAMGAFCILDEDRGIFTDVDNEGHATMTIPEDVNGELEFFGMGICDNDAWVADVARLSFNSTIEPNYLKIENANPLVLAKGQSTEIQVHAQWNDGSSCFVKPSFELIDGEGIAEIKDGIITGKRGGECHLVASYRGMTDSIAVKVIDDFSGINKITIKEDESIRMFTRKGTVIAQFTESYDGNVNIELYNVDGQLIGSTSSGGVFENGDELTFILPKPTGQVYIAVCKTKKRIISMKLMN